MRLVQLANLVTPTSGGIRTVLDRLGRGYQRAGHEVHRVVPAERGAVEVTPAGVVHHLPGVPLPFSGGYRLMVRRRALLDLLDDLAPDRLEVSDRFTLTWVGAWARRRGVPAMVVVHERLSATLRTWVPLGGPVTDLLAADADRRLPSAFRTVVVPSRWAAQAFGTADNVEVVPLGVDLATFHPDRGRRAAAVDGPVRLVAVTRLSREKRPALAVDALGALRAAGVDAELHLLGDGPQRDHLERRARGLPVTFHGFVRERTRVAALVAGCDVALVTCGVETFGLAALEALACGTPVVATTGGAVGELVTGDAGLVADPAPRELASAVRRVLERDPVVRRGAARARAELHPWRRTVARMLELHDAPTAAAPDAPPLHHRAVER